MRNFVLVKLDKVLRVRLHLLIFHGEEKGTEVEEASADSFSVLLKSPSDVSHFSA